MARAKGGKHRPRKPTKVKTAFVSSKTAFLIATATGAAATPVVHPPTPHEQIHSTVQNPEDEKPHAAEQNAPDHETPPREPVMNPAGPDEVPPHSGSHKSGSHKPFHNEPHIEVKGSKEVIDEEEGRRRQETDYVDPRPSPHPPDSLVGHGGGPPPGPPGQDSSHRPEATHTADRQPHRAEPSPSQPDEIGHGSNTQQPTNDEAPQPQPVATRSTPAREGRQGSRSDTAAVHYGHPTPVHPDRVTSPTSREQAPGGSPSDRVVGQPMNSDQQPEQRAQRPGDTDQEARRQQPTVEPSSRQRQPEPEGRHRAPEHEARHRQPEPEGRHRAPEHEARHRQPEPEGRHRAPEHEGRHRQPPPPKPSISM